MKNIKTLLSLLLVSTGLAVATPARADIWFDGRDDGIAYTPEVTSFRLSPGFFYLSDNHAFVEMDVALTTPITRNISVGGRIGALATINPMIWGLPMDVVLDYHIHHFYFEMLGGAWILFPGAGADIHGHIGGGVGILGRGFAIGPEVGWLGPNAGMIGLKLSLYL